MANQLDGSGAEIKIKRDEKRVTSLDSTSAIMQRAAERGGELEPDFGGAAWIAGRYLGLPHSAATAISAASMNNARRRSL